MLRLLPGTAAILLTHLMLAAAFGGIGLAIRRAFGARHLALDDLFLAFWVGFAAVVLFLIGWNFLLPVGTPALVVVLIAGAAGWWYARGDVRDWHSAPGWRPGRGALLAALAVALWVAVNSLGSAHNWDTSLYHLQGEKWAHSYRVVPGLANLMGAFGFNNSALLYDAMVDAGPWAGRPWHVANGLFVVVLASQCLLRGARLLSAERRAADLFALCVLAVPLDALLGDRASSLITDQATTMVLLALTTHWFAMLEKPREPGIESAWDLVAVVALAACAVALKMNAAIFAAVTVVIAASLWLTGQAKAVRRRAMAWATATGLAFGGAWVARGIILSGYPLFPMSHFGSGVSWRAPAEHARAEFDYIVDSGRSTVENLPVVSGQAGFSAWFPNWLHRAADDPYDILVPAALAIAALAAWLALRSRAGADTRAGSRRAWWMLVPLGCAITAWFRVAPEPRYIAPLAWSCAALCVVQAFRLSGLARSPRLGGLVALAVALGISPLFVNPLVDWRRNPDVGPIRALVRANVKIPPPGHWLEPAHPLPALKPFQTRSGLVLNVPDGPAARCWDAPLPCTTNPAPNLRLRVPGSLEGGFIVDGPWEMQNWPEPWRPRYLAAWRAGSGARTND